MKVLKKRRKRKFKNIIVQSITVVNVRERADKNGQVNHQDATDKNKEFQQNEFEM